MPHNLNAWDGHHPSLPPDRTFPASRFEEGTHESPPKLTPERVLRDHGAWVFRHALELLDSEADAEDVAQEVLLRAMRKLPALGCDSFLRTWLRCATTSSALDRRHQRTARDQPLRDAADASAS